MHLALSAMARRSLEPQTTVTSERYETRKMATGELQVRRHRNKAAYTAYMVSVQALSDSSQRGEYPSEDVLRAEAKAFNELASLRQALLEALLAHRLQSKR